MVRTQRGASLRLALSVYAALLAAAVAYAGNPSATLERDLAPRDPHLDATIADLVRRGLINDLDAAAKPAKASKHRALNDIGAAVGVAPVKSTKTSPNWRPAGTTNAKTDSMPMPGALSGPQIAAEPILAGPGPEVAAEPIAATPEPELAEPVLAAPDEAAPRIASIPSESIAPTPAEAEPTPEPALADDKSAEEDDLAPIDELSEVAAPASDSPGDGRIDDLGEDKSTTSEPTLAAPSAAKPLVDAGALPLGEPDRIEKRAENAPAPADPEKFADKEETEAPAVAPAPATNAAPQSLPPLTNNQKLLRDKVRRVLKYYYDRPLNTGNRSPWEVMHCMLSFELHSRIRQEGPQGAPITAVGWLCFNQPCKGRTLMYLNEDRDLRVKVGPALQGHQGQLLAILAQARVRSDYPIKVEGKDYTIADLIEVEKATCYPRTELTFKLIGLLNYLDLNAQWMNDQGMQWNFPKLMDEEMRQPIRTAACGGMHRLSGLSLSVKKRKKLGLPVDGEYAKAEQFVANYKNYAFRLQNPDGSYSTEWFRGPGDEPDIDRRLKTTGHTLEWLIYASSEDQLNYFRTVRGVNYLANIMWANRGRDWEAGPLGHAIHALVLYDRLVYARYDNATPATIAESAPQEKSAAKPNSPKATSIQRRRR